MTVILARNRHGTDEHSRSVHAFPLPIAPDATYLRAACGRSLARTDADVVEMFTGAPCTACLLLAARVTETGEPNNGAESAPQLPTAGTGASTGRYAVALRGEHVRHLVPARPITGRLDGHSVVQTVCGCLGWGPFEECPQWPLCGRCARMPDEAIS
ncbi:hypothetical protein [Haloactinomyces albus]|uniref:Uncharacterized protein n=1 Tax=Haloactinomyces albus TaxID=1352928 RepID=A0AAE3ZFW7_9ACTN|nr:hypothetical protein [Haloactinomyces albus]MDR7303020.1 hypothetical protein [Haloactinomyces albus]